MVKCFPPRVEIILYYYDLYIHIYIHISVCVQEGNRSAVTSVNLLAGHGQRAAETLDGISLYRFNSLADPFIIIYMYTIWYSFVPETEYPSLCIISHMHRNPIPKKWKRKIFKIIRPLIIFSQIYLHQLIIHEKKHPRKEFFIMYFK